MERQLAGIIAAPLVEMVKALGYSLAGESYRFYPDGALRWEGESDFSRTVFRLLQHTVPGGIGHCGFRSPAAIGGSLSEGTVWTLTFPGNYGAFLCEFDEIALAIWPGVGQLVSRDERDPSRLPVLAQLYRKITKPIAEALAEVVRAWYAEIGSKGVFGEQGIRSISPVMRVAGRQACFELDVTGSGQDTLNTLYLALLNWGMSRRQPFSSIDAAADRYEKAFSSQVTFPLT